MTISIERALRHMAWSNQKVFSAVEQLPEESLQSYLLKPEWTAEEILRHICDSAGFYAYRLGVGPKSTTLEEPQKISELRTAVASHDANLISAAGLKIRTRMDARWSNFATMEFNHTFTGCASCH